MAEKSFPWTGNGTGDGTSGGYTALEWSEIWRKAFLGGGEASQGVCKGVENELACTGTATPIAVNTGAAFVYGKFYQNTASVNLSVTTPVVGTTGGHVILRLDWTAQTVRLIAVRNTDGVSSTPSLTQSLSTQWEIRLATFTITTSGVIALTDARGYVHMAQRVATANIDDSAVTTAKIAADSVDDTIAGNRVPQFYRRQGGSASDWSAPGTTTRTPTSVRMQAGVLSVGGSGSSVTFPQAFSNIPIIQLTAFDSTPQARIAVIEAITATGFSCLMYDAAGVTQSGVVHWLAVGPE